MTIRFLPHTADIKFSVTASSEKKLFESCALALSRYSSGGAKVRERKKTQIILSGADRASLLYQFLDELIYLIDAKDFLVARAVVTLKPTTITATLYGDSVAHYGVRHIKAATYAEMEFSKTRSGWKAQAVLDV